MSKCLCVPKTSSVLNARPNRLNVSGDDRAALLLLTLFASPFKSKSRLEAENAALRHQLIVLRRRVRGRVQLTNGDRLFLVQLSMVPHRFSGPSRSSGPRLSYVGIGAAFAGTGVGNPAVCTKN